MLSLVTQKKDEKTSKRPPGPVLIEDTPAIDSMRKRLRAEISRMENALARVPDGKAESHYLVSEERRLSAGMLGCSFPEILLLLENDPQDKDARRALELIHSHTVTEERRMAAELLLRRMGCAPLSSRPAAGAEPDTELPRDVPFGD